MKLRTIAGCLVAAMAPVTASAQLVINELMQSNVECIMDDLNEFPDSWVELYNTGSSAVNLSEYSIGVKSSASKAYRLPARSVAPGAHALIYCDKAEQGLHTSFRLESGKDGAVYLFRSGEIVDKVEGMKKMPSPDIAYGRETDGGAEWGYQHTPTPGKANCGKLVKSVLGDPEFSEPGRVSSQPLALTLSAPADAPAGTVVRYTLDGSEPGTTSPQYTAPISIASTKVVRARLFCDGYLSPRSVAQSYIFFPREMTMPIVSVVCPRSYFYDNKIGIYCDGNYSSNQKNYEYDWRRPVNIEIFETAGTGAVINQLCETRVKGGASRGMGLKSLVMYANKRFGTKRFEYEFFPDDAPGLTDWKSFELRNAGNDFEYLYLRDALIQRMMGRHADLDYQPYRPAIFMLNGEYKGMLNIRSRSNEDYIYTFYDGLEDIDLIENNWELKAGTVDSFNAFQSFIKGTDHTFAEYEQLMDIREYANLMAMNLFYDNKDFPGNNIVCWRPSAEGGRWRWIAKDTDFGLGLYGAPYNYKTFDWFYTPGYDSSHDWANKPDHTRLFRRLMDLPEFKTLFTDICAVYIADFMNGTVTSAELDRMSAAIRGEYANHRPLFNPWWPDYDKEVTAAKTWATQRTDFFLNHLAEYYRLGTPRRVTIDRGRTDDVQLTVNGIGLTGRAFDGRYYEGGTLRISGCSSDGIPVSRWTVRTVLRGETKVESRSGEALSVVVPEGVTELQISSLPGADAIDDISIDQASGPVEVYDLQGISRGVFADPSAAENALPRGIYLLRTPAGTAKVRF